MTTKQLLLQTVKKLPDDASVEDAMERFLFLAKVERGLRQAETGKMLTHDQVKAKMRVSMK
jgi:predicted transcriptional regulator